MFYIIKVNNKLQKSGDRIIAYKTIKEAVKMVDTCYGVNSLLDDVEIDELNKYKADIAIEDKQVVVMD